MPSFGDIILPVVGVSAVILLVLAARQFFINGLKTSPVISSTRAFAESPALIAEREKKSEIENILPASSEPVVSSSENLLSKSEDEFIAMAIATQARAPQVSVTERLKTTRTSTPTTAKASAPKKIAAKQWRVQIGAYTSKAGAQEAAKKVNKAGYKAIVYQNPASKHFKVWVEGGSSKATAERVVQAMQKIGYKGSFLFPPAK